MFRCCVGSKSCFLIANQSRSRGRISSRDLPFISYVSCFDFAILNVSHIMPNVISLNSSRLRDWRCVRKKQQKEKEKIICLKVISKLYQLLSIKRCGVWSLLLLFSMFVWFRLLEKLNWTVKEAGCDVLSHFPSSNKLDRKATGKLCYKGDRKVDYKRPSTHFTSWDSWRKRK